MLTISSTRLQHLSKRLSAKVFKSASKGHNHLYHSYSSYSRSFVLFRPWSQKVAPIKEDRVETVNFPTDDENIGRVSIYAVNRSIWRWPDVQVSIGWHGPEWSDALTTLALSLWWRCMFPLLYCSGSRASLMRAGCRPVGHCRRTIAEGDGWMWPAALFSSRTWTHRAFYPFICRHVQWRPHWNPRWHPKQVFRCNHNSLFRVLSRLSIWFQLIINVISIDPILCWHCNQVVTRARDEIDLERLQRILKVEEPTSWS